MYKLINLEEIIKEIKSESDNNQTLECQIVFNVAKKNIKNQKKFIFLPFFFPNKVFIKPKKVKILTSNIVINTDIESNNLNKDLILKDLKNGRMNSFDILLVDAVNFNLITPFSKKLATQAILPKSELGTLFKNLTNPEIEKLYNEFAYGNRQILRLVPFSNVSTLYVPFSNTTFSVEQSIENLEMLLNNIINILFEGDYFINLRKLKFLNIYIKSFQSKPKRVNISI